AVYWRGGDETIESALFRPQFFDKIVAWGGDAAMRSVQKYLGPGLELIANDPKNSISLIGHEVFDDPETLRQVAQDAAFDVGHQEFCQDSRFQFVEGSVEEVDAYCAALLEALRSH